MVKRYNHLVHILIVMECSLLCDMVVCCMDVMFLIADYRRRHRTPLLEDPEDIDIENQYWENFKAQDPEGYRIQRGREENRNYINTNIADVIDDFAKSLDNETT